mgnify:FL=1
MTRPLILVTNDDGIASPGLAAAAAALDPLGELLIAAPATQQTSMGRSRTQLSPQDGRILPYTVQYGARAWQGFSVQGTPAMVVEHAVQELAPRQVDLAVSGINYGENIGTCITISGTIGAAMEAAERGIPALAVSLETRVDQYYRHDGGVDFRTAAHFLHFFASRLIGKGLPADVDVLKIEVPMNATPETRWMVARQDRLSYYTVKVRRDSPDLTSAARSEYSAAKGQFTQPGTDAYALAQGYVSITPLSLDHTSRVTMDEVQALIEREHRE